VGDGEARVTAPILETRGLSKAFEALRAVADVDLRVEPGELRAIIGPNGAGKTTLFHLISGVVHPSAGEIRFRGEDVTRLPAHARCRRGMSRTFQITSIFGDLPALENVRMAIQLKGGGNFTLLGGRALLRATARRAEATLAELGLGERGALPASTLPHGEQRLLEIAMALAQEPDLLLLDEPTQGLSSEETAATIAVIRRVARARGLTILLVEHDMDVVFNVADRVTVLDFGQVIADGSPAAVRASAEVQKAYLGSIE
jgi:branched-chain amino acid transport system ATP-binding protein